MLGAFIRWLFGKTAPVQPDVRGVAGLTTAIRQTPKADARKVLVAAILELRAVVKSGTAEEIAAAIDVFTAKAIAYDLVPREREGEVAKAELTVEVVSPHIDLLAVAQRDHVSVTGCDGDEAEIGSAVRWAQLIRSMPVGTGTVAHLAQIVAAP